MKKIIISLVALSALSGAAFATSVANSNQSCIVCLLKSANDQWHFKQKLLTVKLTVSGK